MMKNAPFALLLALLWQAVSVSATCQSMTVVFNLKPKYIGHDATDKICGDLEVQAIEEAIKRKVAALVQEYGIDASLGNFKTQNCPAYTCDTNPGDKCLPFCVAMEICSEVTDLRSWSVASLTDVQLTHIKTQAIEEVRASPVFPECLGIRNQFMMDIHTSLVSL